MAPLYLHKRANGASTTREATVEGGMETSYAFKLLCLATLKSQTNSAQTASLLNATELKRLLQKPPVVPMLPAKPLLGTAVTVQSKDRPIPKRRHASMPDGQRSKQQSVSPTTMPRAASSGPPSRKNSAQTVHPYPLSGPSRATSSARSLGGDVAQLANFVENFSSNMVTQSSQCGSFAHVIENVTASFPFSPNFWYCQGLGVSNTAMRHNSMHAATQGSITNMPPCADNLTAAIRVGVKTSDQHLLAEPTYAPNQTVHHSHGQINTVNANSIDGLLPCEEVDSILKELEGTHCQDHSHYRRAG